MSNYIYIYIYTQAHSPSLHKRGGIETTKQA